MFIVRLMLSAKYLLETNPHWFLFIIFGIISFNLSAIIDVSIFWSVFNNDTGLCDEHSVKSLPSLGITVITDQFQVGVQDPESNTKL